MRGEIGLPGRVVVAFSMAGGMTLGGVFLASLTISGAMSSSGIFDIMLVACGVGMLLGLVHGAILAVLGRPADMASREALRTVGKGLIWLPPAAIVTVAASTWVSLSAVALQGGRMFAATAMVMGWIVAAAIFASTLVDGLTALRNAYERWPEHRIGSVLLVLIFILLTGRFLVTPPVLWGVDLALSRMGAFVLAVAGTVWVAAPILIVLLHSIHVRVVASGRDPIPGRW